LQDQGRPVLPVTWKYQAAAWALAAGSKTDLPALPWGVLAQVEGRNWKRPEAPLEAFTA
jgi:hypothetical protein